MNEEVIVPVEEVVEETIVSTEEITNNITE